MERRIFPKGKDERGRRYEDLRWSRFKSFEPREMFTVVDEHVFPYLRRGHPEVLRDPKLRQHFHETMFNGFDFDGTMLRIGAMNMMLHGVENAHIVYRDSLAEEHNADAGRYSLILANPPFAGALD